VAAASEGKMWVWDEISGEAKAVTDAHPVDCPLDWEGHPQTEQASRFNASGWESQHVLDLPDGTRIVIESDERAHTAVLVTQPTGRSMS
jgi:hypothetical protein